MPPVRVILFSLLACLSLRAEEGCLMPDAVVESAQLWMRENVDDWIFDAAGIDRETVHESLEKVQEGLRSVLPANPETQCKDAEQMVKVLQEFDGTKSMAIWLRAFLDQHRPAALQETNGAVEPTLAPGPREMRDLWMSVIRTRPAPRKAGDYLSQIKPIFQSERVPAELVWLAEVESAFDPQAKSPVGAVGLFQLMPDTAQSLGLSTWLPDERRNAEKNARAAAQYLQYLHDRFGNWPLALAAYNAGPTRVSRLLRKSDTYSYEAIAPQLPAETRDYVAKVEATLFVREGVELAFLSNLAE
jgi:hypothetical protein